MSECNHEHFHPLDVFPFLRQCLALKTFTTFIPSIWSSVIVIVSVIPLCNITLTVWWKYPLIPVSQQRMRSKLYIQTGSMLHFVSHNSFPIWNVCSPLRLPLSAARQSFSYPADCQAIAQALIWEVPIPVINFSCKTLSKYNLPPILLDRWPLEVNTTELFWQGSIFSQFKWTFPFRMN